MNRRWVWLVVGCLGLAMKNASAEPDGPPPVAVPVTPAAVLPAPVSPASAGPFDDSRRDELQRQIAIAELELRLAETRAKIAEAQRRAAPPPPVVAVAPPPAPAPAPVAVPASIPAAPVVQSPPAATKAPPVAQRPAAGAGRTRRGEPAHGTVGYLAQAGALKELRQAGGGRLRAVPVDARRPLLRPGPGVIADPVGSPALAVADSTAATAAGSKTRWQRTLGGGGDADMGGLGLPPPLPGLSAGAGK